MMRRPPRASSNGAGGVAPLRHCPRVEADPADSAYAAEAPRHHLQGFRMAIHEEKAPPCLETRGPGGAAAREEVEDEIAGAGRGLHDAPEHAKGFLGRIAGALPSLGGHDGVPPGIGGQLAT